MNKIYLIVAVMAYLLGSIPFGYLLVRIFRGEDIRLTGSGNIGATNVARSGAKGLGIATLVLDAMKGALAVWLAEVLAGSKYNLCGDFVQHPCAPASCTSIRPSAAGSGTERIRAQSLYRTAAEYLRAMAATRAGDARLFEQA